MEASGLLHASAAFPVIRSPQWTLDRTVVGWAKCCERVQYLPLPGIEFYCPVFQRVA